MNKKTSDELSLGVIDGTELVRVAKGGQNYKTTLAAIAAYAGGGGAAGLPTVLGINATTGAHNITLSDNGGGVFTQSITDGFGAGSLFRFANSGLDASMYAANDAIVFASNTARVTGNNQVLITATADVVVTAGVGVKIASTTASRALVTDASNYIISSAVTATELGYVSGVTSAIQTQLNAKQSSITFGTGVQTALGVNIGSAGAVILLNGALGTPSSGTLTNCTFPTLNQNTSGYSSSLKSATTTVDVSAATAPTTGQVLTATSSTTATWQTPSSSGANTALSNLASVSINTSLLAQTGVDLGGTSNQFRDLYLFGSGTYGTTYLKLTGTPTSTRTWTIQDATDTFVGLATTDTLTNKKLSSSTTTIVDNTDATKIIGFSLSGMTTAKTLTLSTAQTTTQQLNFPNITGTDTLATLGLAQTFTGANTHSGLNAMLVSSSGLTVRNPANTFKYTITAAAIVADRTLNLPLITGTSTLACLDIQQSFSQLQIFTAIRATTSLSVNAVSSSANLFVVGNNASNGVYRSTNAGADITPQISFVPNGLATSGVLGWFFDVTQNGLGFTHANGTRQIMGASIGLTNLTNTAGSEAGDLAFYTQTAGAAAALRLTLSSASMTLIDAYDINLGTTTGTKLGTVTQKLGIWGATPIVQPTTAVAAATFVANTSLIANDTATFDGYTIGQVVKALRNIGLLA